MQNQHLVAPSILAADFNRLGKEIEMLNLSAADWIHCDVMDGSFVPNISFGMPILKAVKSVATKPLDVHLMIDDPARYIEAFHEVGAQVLTVHQEAVNHLDRTLQAIRAQGMKAGVALNPATPIETVQHVLHLADVVLLMTVNPGFGGQSFIPYVLDKVVALKQMIQAAGTPTLIEVDGGVDDKTAPALLRAGVDVLVAGSYVFRAKNPSHTIAQLKQMRSAQQA
ncbi:MAG: ribulose-phosphate 3-epimerase [Bacteroidota bacterium]